LDESTTNASGDGVSTTDWLVPENSTSVSDYSDLSDLSSQPQLALTDQSELTDEQKLQTLHLVFPGQFKDHTLQIVLRENNGDIVGTIEDLLSRAAINEEGARPKGIDGFVQEEYTRANGSGSRGTKKAKGKSSKNANKLTISYKAVSSTGQDEELQGAADFLPSPARPARRLPPQPRPPPVSTSSISFSTPTSPTIMSPISPALPPCPSSDMINHSASQASSLLRGRAGPLGRQGAVVYTERLREALSLQRAHISREADAIVAKNSTKTSVDLHGVNVADGVRIADQRLRAWWDAICNDESSARRGGAKRTVREGGGGFTVITGQGKHSKGGVSPMRQTVGAYLRNNGWRFEVLTGGFLVTGRT